MKKRSNEWRRRADRDEKLAIVFLKNGYVPTKESMSQAFYKTHWLRTNYAELPGVDAYEEMLKFLITQKKKHPIGFNFNYWYKISLKVALNRVKGRRFLRLDGTKALIETPEDVEQVVREILRASGIPGKLYSVRGFVMKNIA